MHLLVSPKNIESISQFQPDLTEGFFCILSGWVETESPINSFFGGRKAAP